MACDIKVDTSIGDDCNTGQGGVSYFYPFPFLENAFTVVDGEATAMDAGLTAAYSFAIAAGDGNSLEQPMIVDQKTGNKVCTQTFTAQLIGYTASGNNSLDRFATGKSSGVLRDRNGVYYWIASDEGFNNVTINPVTGAGINDFNGNNIIAVATTKKVAPILDSATVTAFLAVVVAPA